MPTWGWVAGKGISQVWDSALYKYTIQPIIVELLFFDLATSCRHAESWLSLCVLLDLLSRVATLDATNAQGMAGGISMLGMLPGSSLS